MGKGRFGDVYLVREKRLGMVMAMKIINKQELKESDMMNQLIFEIKIQSFISHPNTLQMYGYFQDEKYIYMLL
jgi:serine/threonine protein kinase